MTEDTVQLGDPRPDHPSHDFTQKKTAVKRAEQGKERRNPLANPLEQPPARSFSQAGDSREPGGGKGSESPRLSGREL